MTGWEAFWHNLAKILIALALIGIAYGVGSNQKVITFDKLSSAANAFAERWKKK